MLLQRVFELPGDGRRSSALQGLRGLAVILVFWVHYDTLMRGYLPEGSTAAAFSTFAGHAGHAGVDLFFTLSGMLIYTLVMRPFEYRRFVIRRIQRIYPSFLCVLILYTIIALIFPDTHKLPAGAAPAARYWVVNLLLLPGLFRIPPIITVAWSLSYEAFFYIALPAIAAAARLRRWPARFRMRALAAVACGGLGLAALHLLPHPRMLMFVAGMLAWELVNSPAFAERITPRLETGAAALFLVSLPSTVWLSADVTGPGWSASGLAVLFAADALLVACAYRGAGWLSRGLGWTPLRWLGNISYSFYLLHGLVLRAVTSLAALALVPGESAAGYWLLVPVSWSLAVAASTLLFVLVERPFSLAAAPAGRSSVHPAISSQVARATP